MIYLLDLNHTLVSNSHVKASPFADQIEGETYDADLLARLTGQSVILITARPEKYRCATLSSISSKTGWSPMLALFNEYGLPPPKSKERALIEHVFSRYGEAAIPYCRYFGIESNPQTRAMYRRYGIASATKADWMASFDDERFSGPQDLDVPG